MFVQIRFFDLKRGPIISNNFPQILDEVLNPNSLKKQKKIIMNKN